MLHQELAAPLPVASGKARPDVPALRASETVFPPVLARLLAAPVSRRDEAWPEFVAEYSWLLLHTARAVASDRDEAMDAYAMVLDRLREDDCRRLRAYAADERAKFTTWLVVVARRICVDSLRTRYGRDRPAATAAPRDRRQLRRELSSLSDRSTRLEAIPADGAGAEGSLVAEELRGALAQVVDDLGPADRLLLRLRFDDGLGGNEIAAILRMPTAFHVYRRVNALLARLRKALRERGIDGPAG